MDIHGDDDADPGVEKVDQLQWAEIQRLPSLKRLRTSLFEGKRVVDVAKLGALERHLFIDKLIKHIENDNLRLLRKLRNRIDRVNVTLPSVEVRYKNLFVEAEYEVVQGKPLPTLWNSLMSMLSVFKKAIWCGSRETRMSILKDVSGIIKPSRFTLLLGPPGSGKTTFLLALAEELDKSLKASGEISYNGYKLDEFVPQKTSAYISQYDMHIAEMTVRETIDFSARCQGVGSRTGDFFVPPAISVEGQSRNLQTDYILKILGLDICGDIMVGDALRRGISGGQKKRLTTASLPPWLRWAFWVSPMSYGEIAITLNEFRAPRWQKVSKWNTTLGELILTSHGLNFDDYFFWISLGALFGMSILCDLGFVLSLTYLKPKKMSRPIISKKKLSELQGKDNGSSTSTAQSDNKSIPAASSQTTAESIKEGKGSLVLPFEPLTISFKDVQYYVDTPALILMKMGGQIIYSGMLGHHSSKLIEYFEGIPGVPRIKDNYNPATWMLEISSASAEAELGIDFANIYKESAQYRWVAVVGMYSSKAYSFAQVSIEIPYILMQTILYVAITYPIIGYSWSAYKVFWLSHARAGKLMIPNSSFDCEIQKLDAIG
ncbi:hypothetical protein FEM48_Zijuj12G0213100 [Ziziphus jujuba var. spinosa]|uniref:ABC transporter domain-containing protein n=1 Tax=Ziziphus jujuba var. spinosa TaxID=714518 RepID=A0A978UFL7_ZIZJJ|nr:hypothetical protein FEM48_Zijuj12G0213100 [Ziziphus jujuba var. spinosa]